MHVKVVMWVKEISRANRKDICNAVEKLIRMSG